jgi:TonB family protein
MRGTRFGCLLLSLLISCSSHKQEVLSPRHIETPNYPPLARMARIMGKVNLTLTIDGDGNVKSAEATKDNSSYKAHPLLEAAAIENVRKWTFSKPSHVPITQTIIYDYEFDEALPATSGYLIGKVYFDLPDRVTIVSNLPSIETSE